MEKMRLVLDRKYPLAERVVNRGNRVKGCKFQLSNDPQFEDLHELFNIDRNPLGAYMTELVRTYSLLPIFPRPDRQELRAVRRYRGMGRRRPPPPGRNGVRHESEEPEAVADRRLLFACRSDDISKTHRDPEPETIKSLDIQEAKSFFKKNVRERSQLLMLRPQSRLPAQEKRRGWNRLLHRVQAPLESGCGTGTPDTPDRRGSTEADRSQSLCC